MHWQFINNCLSNSPVSRVKQHPTMHFYLEQWVRVSPYNRSNKSERTAVPIYYHFAIKYRLFNWLCIFIILSTVQIDNDQPSHPSHLPLIPTNATSTILSPIINIASTNSPTTVVFLYLCLPRIVASNCKSLVLKSKLWPVGQRILKRIHHEFKSVMVSRVYCYKIPGSSGYMLNFKFRL